MSEHYKENSLRNKTIGAALLAGLLLHIAVLLALLDRPNEVVGMLTGFYVPTTPIDRALKYPLAVFFIALFYWRTVTLYRKRLMLPATQLAFTVLGLVLGWTWFFIVLSQLKFTFIH